MVCSIMNRLKQKAYHSSQIQKYISFYNNDEISSLKNTKYLASSSDSLTFFASLQ